jgi:hypothetical protein
MAMTLSELAETAKKAEIVLNTEEGQPHLWGHWNMDFFTHPGIEDKTLELRFGLAEDGEFLYVMSLSLYSLKDCAYKPQVFEALLSIAYVTKSVSYEYDPTDGEVRATIEMPIEDGRLTPDQLAAMCNFMAATIDGYDTVIRHAMKTGTIDMSLEGKPLPDPEKQELNDLLAKIGGIETLKKLAAEAPKKIN